MIKKNHGLYSRSAGIRSYFNINVVFFYILKLFCTIWFYYNYYKSSGIYVVDFGIYFYRYRCSIALNKFSSYAFSSSMTFDPYKKVISAAKEVFTSKSWWKLLIDTAMLLLCFFSSVPRKTLIFLADIHFMSMSKQYVLRVLRKSIHDIENFSKTWI